MRTQFVRGSLAVLAAFLLGASGPAVAQTVGTVVSGVVTVAGKQVPLPPGNFTVVAVGTTNASMTKGSVESERLDLGPIRTATLARIADGRVPVVVEIAANLVPHHDGWGTTADCRRKDLYAAISNYTSGWDVSCLYLKPLAVQRGTPAPGGDAVAKLASGQGATVSSFWIAAGLRVADRQDVVDVRYNIDPASLGVPATAATAPQWEPSAIEGQPARLAVVQDIAAWTGGVAEPLSAGLRGRLETDAFPAISGAATIDSGTAERTARADALRKLHESGAITQDQFDEQMAAIAGPVAAAGAASWTYAQVAGWKAFTYRVVVTTINAGIDYVFIGRPFAAGVLVILQVVVNTTKFFFHEMMWQEVFGISPLQRDTPNVIEFGRTLTASAGAASGSATRVGFGW